MKGPLKKMRSERYKFKLFASSFNYAIGLRILGRSRNLKL